MHAQQTSDLIQMLQRVAARPAAFFGTADVLLATSFLCGFRTALTVAHGVDWHLADGIIADRGWQPCSAAAPALPQQMLGAGLSPAEVIKELVTIEIEVLKRSFA